MELSKDSIMMRRGLPVELRAFLLWAISLSLTSILFCGVAYLIHSEVMYYQALSPPGQHFTDFSIYQEKFGLFHQVAFFHNFFPFTYPAPVALVYEAFFTLFGGHATLAFVLFSVAAVIVPAALFSKALKTRGLRTSLSVAFAAALLLLSWPAILVIDRGNMEIIVWISLALATWAFATGRTYLAATFFGIAAALKLFPFIFFTIFFSTRRFKELGVAVGVFLGGSLAGLAALGPTVSIATHGIIDGLHYFAVFYMARWNSWENGVDHSLFAAIKMALILGLHHAPQAPFTRELSVYNLVTGVAGIVLYFLRIRFLPLLNQILILSIISIYFTAFSGDGTLFHLYYSIAMLSFVALDAHRRSIRVPGLQLALSLLAFLVSYEGFFVVRNHRFEGEVKCLALGWLLVVAFRYPFGSAMSQRVSADSLAHPDARLIEASDHP